MAISNYTELQAAVINYHHRDDGRVADHIAFAEKRINRRLQDRLSEFETALVGTIDSNTIALPAGFVSHKALWLTEYGNRIGMVYVLPEELPVIYDSNSQPSYYTIDGANIVFNYKMAGAYNFLFRYKKGYSIATTSTNHILTNYPGCYLYGALREAAILSEDQDAAQKYEALFQQEMEDTAAAEFNNKTYATMAIDPALSGTSRPNILAGDM